MEVVYKLFHLSSKSKEVFWYLYYLWAKNSKGNLPDFHVCLQNFSIRQAVHDSNLAKMHENDLSRIENNAGEEVSTEYLL